MNLEGILSISGKPGLYQLVSQTRGGILVESLTDGKRFPIAASAQVSALSDIAIYTYSEEVPLADVLTVIAKKEDLKIAGVKPKAKPEELKKYFLGILPEYDEDRVYASDIKKVISWYNQLHAKGMLKLDEEKKAVEVKEEKTEPKAKAAPKVKAEPKPKAATKPKAAAAKATVKPKATAAKTKK
ncbi:MAG: hypothetical protein ACI8ZO_000723 [Flavobacteriales bacterium]|jgi:hypothetical protein